MTEREIVIEFLQDKENCDKLITVAYEEPFYEFIMANASVISNKNGVFYKLSDYWMRIIKKQ